MIGVALFILLLLFQSPGHAGPSSPAPSLFSISPVKMIFIPEGSFVMGTGQEAGRAGEDYGVDEEPPHTVYLKSFFIDPYEVTVGEYQAYLKSTDKTWPGDETFPEPDAPLIFFNPEGRSNYPMNYVSWHNASDYCRWAGKRLPTEEEWEKGARGLNGATYPWGSVFTEGKTNSQESKLGKPAPVGSFPEDKSPYGLYDVASNLQEWTSSQYLPYPGNTLNDGRWTTQAYVLKGGSFLLPGKLFARPASRSIAYAAYAHRMFGFRCAKDASPSP